MSVEQEAAAKPKPKRKSSQPDVLDSEPKQGPLPDFPPREVDPEKRMFVVAVEDVRSSVDNLRDDMAGLTKELRESCKAIAMVTQGQTSDNAKSVDEMRRQTEKVETLIEAFAAFLTLTSEADKSTRKRVRLMVAVLRQALDSHDKDQAKHKPLSRANIALLASVSALAIIGLVAVIGWVLQ